MSVFSLVELMALILAAAAIISVLYVLKNVMNQTNYERKSSKHDAYRVKLMIERFAVKTEEEPKKDNQFFGS